MAENLKIIPLGGLDAIGKNMTVFECKGDMVLDDAGLMFPDDNHPGVDLILPDYTYVLQHADKLRGIVITHGHEDHTGSLPYLIKDLDRQVPIYGTKMTLGLIEGKFKEHRIKNAKLVEIKPGDKVNLGCITAEFFAVNHSIPGAVGVFFRSPAGNVLHTGDFKIDATAEDGMIDLARFGALGKEGVLALLCDSTNVERQGYTPSEKTVAANFERQFSGCNKRIIVTTFASNAFRLQSLIATAKKFGRKVAVTGRSMENILKVSTELGYLKIPAGTLVDITQIKQIPNNKLVIVSTGSQGENMSALYRMAFSGHRQVEITASDRVIISASAIPGNEKSIGKIINELYRKGAEVIYDKLEGLHVSGHACQEELKIIHGLLKPRFFIPVRRIPVWPSRWAWIPRTSSSPTSVRCSSSPRPPASGAAPSRPARSWSTAPVSATSAASCCVTASIWRRTACWSWSSTSRARTAASSAGRISSRAASSMSRNRKI